MEYYSSIFPGLPELDQASSGFEDCSSLIRPKASVDSTHTTAAPSVNESTRVHKPQSLADSLRISTKLPSESDFEKTSKAPSISSSGSNKSSSKYRNIVQICVYVLVKNSSTYSYQDSRCIFLVINVSVYKIGHMT